MKMKKTTGSIVIVTMIFGLHSMEHRIKDISEMYMQEKETNGLDILIDVLDSSIPSHFVSEIDKEEYLQVLREELKLYETECNGKIDADSYFRVINSLNEELNRVRELPILEEK